MQPIDDARKLQNWFERVKADRGNTENTWQEIDDHCFGMHDVTRHTTPGEQRMDLIYDTTAMFSNQLLAGGLHGILTTPAGVWIDLETDPPNAALDSDARFWLDDSRTRTLMHLNSSRSGWTTNLAETYLTLPAFGTGSLWIDARPGIGAVASARPLRETYVEADSDGRPDVHFREVPLTARQFVQAFPKPMESVTAVERALEKGDLETEFTIVQYVGRNPDPYAGQSRFRKPWVAVSWMVDQGTPKLLDRKGYDERPLITPRWSVRTGEVYGYGPGWTTLPACKMLNAMWKTIIKAAQKAADPPLLASDMGILSSVRTTPGGITYVQDRPGIGGQPDALRPLSSRGDIGLGVDLIDRTVEAVRTGYWAQILTLFENPNMSATEVIARGVQAQRVMAPISGRIAQELLEPAIDRVFGILLRGGHFLPVPSSLRGVTVRPRFVSAISRSQSLSDAEGILQAWNGAGAIAQLTQNPEAFDHLDPGASVRLLHRAADAPEAILRDIADVERDQVARAQVAQQENALGAAGQGADIAAKLAQANAAVNAEAA